MNSSPRPAKAGDRTGRDCDCDPGLLDDLKCRAYGIAEQAAYNGKVEPGLETARTAYEGARAAYSAARTAAQPQVSDARRQLEDLIDRIRCQLDRQDVERIDRAFGRTVERLDRCGVHTGCCCEGDCDYDDVSGCDPDDIPGRKAVITRLTVEATDCFTELVNEPNATADTPPPQTPPPSVPVTPPTTAPTGRVVVSSSQPPASSPPPAAPAAASTTPAVTPTTSAKPRTLPDRVKDLLAEIEKITKATADGSWEPSKLYASVLVARRHLELVWRGFATVNDYMDCLCRALTCMIRGHAAISELTRKAAVHKCFRDSWKAACIRLEIDTVAEVLAEYIRVCDEDGPSEDGGEHHDHHHDHDHRHEHHRPQDGDETSEPYQPGEDGEGQPAWPSPTDAPPSEEEYEEPRSAPAASPRGYPDRPYGDERGGYRAP